MHSLQVGCPADRHGKPIIHLNTKPERCMWLKLMLFLPLLKLSRRGHLLPVTDFFSLLSRFAYYYTPREKKCKYFFERLFLILTPKYYISYCQLCIFSITIFFWIKRKRVSIGNIKSVQVGVMYTIYYVYYVR